MGSDDDNLCFRMGFAYLACGSDAIQLAGHFQVHEYHVGMVLLDSADSGCAGIGFGDDGDIRQGLQVGAHALADYFVIVNEQDFDSHFSTFLTGAELFCGGHV
jgi:hypothetical protein